MTDKNTGQRVFVFPLFAIPKAYASNVMALATSHCYVEYEWDLNMSFFSSIE